MADENKSSIRIVNTGQFGEIEVSDEHIFWFEEGLLGFENLREFVLISDEETAPFRWLISIEEPEIGFPLLSPWHIDLSYKPPKKVDIGKEVIMVIITLENGQGNMTANMKAPIIFEVENKTGKQVIFTSDRYSTNFIIPLGEAKKETV